MESDEFEENNDIDLDVESIHDQLLEQLNLAFEFIRSIDNEDIDFRKTLEDLNNRNEYDLWLEAKKNFLYYPHDIGLDDATISSDNIRGGSIGNIDTYDASSTNSYGLPYGTALYGIFLSLPGANVFSVGNSDLKSTNAILKNIKIHGLRHRMHEYVRMQKATTFVVNPFNALLDMKAVMSDVTHFQSSEYVGNILIDAYAALDYLSTSWGLLQMSNMGDKILTKFILDVDELKTAYYDLKCNADVMTHSGKGTMGIRLDGISKFTLDNIEIYNMYDFTSLGTDICGSYDGTRQSNGHFLQKVPMQQGFSGNMVHGIHIVNSDGELKDINVHDIGSATGLAFGVSVYKKSDVVMNGDLLTSNIIAGFMVGQDTLDYNDRPNQAPEACGILVYWSYDDGDEGYTGPTVSSTDEDGLNIVNQCIRGHVGCFNNELFGASTLGTYVPCESSTEGIVGAINSDTEIADESVVIAHEYQMDVDAVMWDNVQPEIQILNVGDFDERTEAIDFTASKRIHKANTAVVEDDIEEAVYDRTKIDSVVFAYPNRWYVIILAVMVLIALIVAFFDFLSKHTSHYGPEPPKWKLADQEQIQEALYDHFNFGEYGSC